MNLTADESNPDLLFVNFNQDFSSISVGHKNGYKIYNCDPFGKAFSKSCDEHISLVEMLFSTSLVAISGLEKNNQLTNKKLQIINTKRDTVICELSFNSNILSVKLNRRRLLVVLVDQIYVYDVSNMKLLHTIETSSNPKGICSLSSSSENSYLVYPAPSSQDTSPFSSPPITSQNNKHQNLLSGDALIFDTITLQVVNIVQAHKTPVSNLVLNSSGTLLATASEKGTVIRIFSVPEGQKIHQFRRGTYPANISSITFNIMSTLLCVSSDTETIHIFNLSQQIKSSTENSTENTLEQSTSPKSPPLKKGNRKSLQKYLSKKIANHMGNYIPGKISEMWEPERDFAFLKMGSASKKCIASLSNTGPQVMVISANGYYYEFDIDLEKGGECMIAKQHNLFMDSSDNETQ